MYVSPSGSGTVKSYVIDYYGKEDDVKYFPPEEFAECYDKGDKVYLKAIASSGYQFDHWETNPLISEFSQNLDQVSYTHNEPHEITAYFVKSGNNDHLPIANAGPDQTVKPGSVVQLDGSKSYDPDGGALTYKWTQTGGTRVALSNDTSDKPTFTAPVVPTEGETLTFKLTVAKKTNSSLSSSDEIKVIISADRMPVANAGPDQTVKPGSVVQLDGSKSYDPDGGELTYKWTQTGGTRVVISDDTSEKPTFTAPVVPKGGETLTFKLTVAKKTNSSLSSSDIVDIKIISTIRADAGPDQTVRYGENVKLVGSNSISIENSIKIYQWSIIETSDGIDKLEITISNDTTAIASFIAPSVTGRIRAQLMVKNAKGESAYATTNIDVKPVGDSDGLRADAGPDQIVITGSKVQLDASQSSAPYNGIKQYQWQQKEGPSVVLSGSSEFNPTFTTQMKPTFSAPPVNSEILNMNVLKFELTIIDNTNRKSSDEVLIYVVSKSYVAASKPPMAKAGTDQTVSAGSIVTLDGSGTYDPEEKLFAYKWDIVNGPSSIVLWADDIAKPSFMAPFVPGSATFQLTVTDDAAHTSADQVTVTWKNDPPMANAGLDQTVQVGDTVFLDGSGSSDTDDGIDKYHWAQIGAPKVILLNSNTPALSFIAPSFTGTSKELVFQLTVTDRANQTSTDEVTITVENNANPPMAHAGKDRSVKETTMVMLNGSASSDLDGDIVSYHWAQRRGPAATLIDSDKAISTFYAPKVSKDVVLEFQLTVTDAGGRSDTGTVKITVEESGIPPVSNAGQDQIVYEGHVVTLDGSGSKDADDTIKRYLWTQVSGPEITLSNPGAACPTFTAPAYDALQNELIFQLEVFDQNGLRSADDVKVSIKASVTPPVAEAGPDQVVNEGDIVMLDGSGSFDPDDGIKSYHWEQMSGVAVILSNPSFQKPSFEAPKISKDSSALSFKLTVEDFSGRTDSDQVSVTINRHSSGGGGGCFISSIGD